MDISYILNELGEEHNRYFNAVAPPIIQTSNFMFPDVETMRRMVTQEYELPIYTRGNNPTVEILRKKLAALEGAEDALVLASGSAAIATAVIANVNQGDHIVSVAKPYSWTVKLMQNFLPRFGVTTTFVDGTDVQNFENALQPNTKLIYLESPNTFTFELQDLAAVAKLARSRGILTMIDNSYSTPLYQRPIELGIDLILYSASKYIGGHSDVVAGVICGTRTMMQKIFYSEYMTLGGIISPMNAWLMIRGLRTLPLRLDRSARTTAEVVAYLENHPKVRRVYYPFAKTNPQLDLAHQQMAGCGGLLTISLETDQMSVVDRFANALKRFLLGVSWGGHESLVFPASIGYADGVAQPGDTGYNLIRLYVGLEEPEVLIADLKQAFEQI